MIAIIAGTGNLPIQACNALAANKKDFFVVSLFPENNVDALTQAIPPSTTIVQKPFYKAHTILSILKEHNTSHVLFIGKVDKQNLLKKFKMDWFTVKMLASLATKSDMSIMDKVEKIVEDHGMKVLCQHDVLGGLHVAPGILTGTLTKVMKESIAIGLAVATNLSSSDIGQTVVVKDTMVLAVEAIEGTDACIKRGITLGGKGVIVCKTANAHHNTKFDLPTIGSHTLANITPGQVVAIAWQSHQTLIADKEKFIARAAELGITLVSVG